MAKKAKIQKDIQVVNIVVSTSLEHDIPLEKMAATLSNTEYNPERFPGLFIRFKHIIVIELDLVFSSSSYSNKILPYFCYLLS